MRVGYWPKVPLEYQGHFIEHDGVGRRSAAAFPT
jgi:hypothetical protein